MRQGTYSIAARDPRTGELGVAVQSHWFSVGSLCSWARPGAGAVATQSIIEPAYGPRGLERMGGGESAPDALAGLLAADSMAAVRQVAFVDARGRVAVHTGADCISHAGDATGDQVTCQANMMERDTVPAAMLAAYQAGEGSLAERLLAALHAGEEEGGDVRGRQSAALLVVPAEGEGWQTTVSLRVEDHGDPIGELDRLVRLHRAYTLAGEADELQGAGRAEHAAPLYRRAAEIAPESDELLFWAGLAIAGTDLADGVDAVRRAAAVNPKWLVLLDRLSPAFAPTGDAVRRELRGGRGGTAA